jgi:hypothetical protein
MSLAARLLKITALSTAALLSACGGGGGGGGGGGPPVTDAGTLKVALTDGPACGYTNINITVQKVRVNQSATAADGDAGWSEIVLSTPQKIDLLSYTNGNVLELGSVLLPVGNYKQMSLVLDTSTPLANSVVPFGQAETPLAVPAGLQSGLKIPISIDVASGQTSDYVLDVDACNSVLRLGQPATGYDLSARYSVIQRLSATGMRVTGFVATSLQQLTTRVSLQSDPAGAVAPTIVRSTVPDSTGMFVLYPVPPGTYNLVISEPSRVVTLVTNVTVAASTPTVINTSTPAIDPPVAVIHTVSGTVNTGTTPVDARVAVIKRYAGGPDVVFAGAPADASIGALIYTVPATAAIRATFALGSPLGFSNDTTAPSGLFTIAVTSGASTKTLDVDATNGDPAPISFTFP